MKKPRILLGPNGQPLGKPLIIKPDRAAEPIWEQVMKLLANRSPNAQTSLLMAMAWGVHSKHEGTTLASKQKFINQTAFYLENVDKDG